MFTFLSDSSFINRSGCGRNSNGLRWRWLVFWFWLCHLSGTRPWVVGFGSPCLSFFIGKMRSLNKIKSESPSTYKLCISSQKAAHTVLVSFHRHWVSGSVPGTGDTEINDTQSLSKRTDSWVENTVLQTDGYVGRRGAEGSTEEGLDCPRAEEFGEGDLEEVRVKSALWRNCPRENKKEEGTGQRWVSCAHLSLLYIPPKPLQLRLTSPQEQFPSGLLFHPSITPRSFPSSWNMLLSSPSAPSLPTSLLLVSPSF